MTPPSEFAMPSIVRALVFALALVSFAGAANAQPARVGRLLVTAVDQSRAVIPGATITVVGLDATTKKILVAPAKSSDKGVAIFEGLALGPP